MPGTPEPPPMAPLSLTRQSGRKPKGRADKADPEGGRPPRWRGSISSTSSPLGRVRAAGPVLKHDLLLRAAEERICVSEAMRRAIGQ